MFRTVVLRCYLSRHSNEGLQFETSVFTFENDVKVLKKFRF